MSSEDDIVNPNDRSQETEADQKEDGDYTVGYKKPPLHSRFKKGVSGNPKGKQKNTQPRDMLKTVQDVFLREISIREGDQTRDVPKVIALIEKILADALRGDPRAKALAYQMANVFGVFRIKDKTTLDLSMLTSEERAHIDKTTDLLRKATVITADGTAVPGSDVFPDMNWKPTRIRE